jgi:hypothetical protein
MLYEISLHGSLNFACSVVLPGRAFSRRLIQLTAGHSSRFHHIRLTKETKEDLLVWKEFLDGFNGKSFFHGDEWLSNKQLQLHTDSSGSLGFGALYKTHWFYGTWPEQWKSFNITVLELFPIVLAVFIWGTDWANQNIIFFTDNEALVSVINTKSSKEKRVMCLIRVLVKTCLFHNIVVKAKHIPGKKNVFADMLSRLQIDTFHNLAPWADSMPTMIPPHLYPTGWNLQ